MARLQIEIGANASGLQSEASKAIGILARLQAAADKLQIDLFSAQTTGEIKAIGAALTGVTNQIKNYTHEALKGSAAWRDQKSVEILRTLSEQLQVVNGNAQLFGQSLRNQNAELRAYQRAIDALLKAGIDPMDERVQKLRVEIERLNGVLQPKGAKPGDQFKATGSIIADLESRIRRIREALRNAFDSRQIVSLNRRLRETQAELKGIQSLGTQTGLIERQEQEIRDLTAAWRAAGNQADVEKYARKLALAKDRMDELTRSADRNRASIGRAGTQFNYFGLELGRVIQDAPYAANNFGAIGNNLTRMVEVIPSLTMTLRAQAAAMGLAATNANLFKLGLKSLFTGINGVILAFSVITSAITIYSMRQKEAKKNTDDLATSLREAGGELKTLSRIMQESSANSGRETIQLRALYEATQDTARTMEDRRRAAAELQRQYPRYLGNMSQEEIIAGNASAAYKSLADNILASAQARAVQDALVDVAKEHLRVILQIPKALEEEKKAQEELDAYNRTVSEVPRSGRQAVAINTEVARLTANSKQATLAVEGLYSELDKIGGLRKELSDTLSAFSVEQLIGDFDRKVKKETDKTQDLLDNISGVFDPSEAAREGLPELDAAIDKIQTKYTKLYNNINEAEAKALKDFKGTEQERAKFAIQVAQLASDERVQVAAAEAKEIEAANTEFARKRLQQYTKVDVEAVRRLRESRTKTMLRQLNDEIAAEEKAAEKRLKVLFDLGVSEAELKEAQLQEQLKLQQKYQKEFDRIQQLDRETKVKLAFDGDALSVPLARVRQEMDELRDAFERNSISADQFREKMGQLAATQDQLNVFKSAIDGVTDSFGNLFSDAFFNGENALQNFGESFERIVNSIISGLIKLAARYAINQAIATASMAATTAATAATAATLTSFWAPAATLASIATFGAAAAAGTASVAASLASVKALSLAGLKSGGYTGNVGVNDIAGVVHGQEYVINAAATRKYRGLLEAINSGSLRTRTSAPVVTSGIDSGLNEGTFVLRGQDLYLAMQRAGKWNARFN